MDHIAAAQERIVTERLRQKLNEVNSAAQSQLSPIQDHVNFTLQVPHPLFLTLYYYYYYYVCVCFLIVLSFDCIIIISSAPMCVCVCVFMLKLNSGVMFF